MCRRHAEQRHLTNHFVTIILKQIRAARCEDRDFLSSRGNSGTQNDDYRMMLRDGGHLHLGDYSHLPENNETIQSRVTWGRVGWASRPPRCASCAEPDGVFLSDSREYQGCSAFGDSGGEIENHARLRPFLFFCHPPPSPCFPHYLSNSTCELCELRRAGFSSKCSSTRTNLLSPQPGTRHSRFPFGHCPKWHTIP